MVVAGHRFNTLQTNEFLPELTVNCKACAAGTYISALASSSYYATSCNPCPSYGAVCNATGVWLRRGWVVFPGFVLLAVEFEIVWDPNSQFLMRLHSWLGFGHNYQHHLQRHYCTCTPYVKQTDVILILSCCCWSLWPWQTSCCHQYSIPHSSRNPAPSWLSWKFVLPRWIMPNHRKAKCNSRWRQSSVARFKICWLCLLVCQRAK